MLEKNKLPFGMAAAEDISLLVKEARKDDFSDHAPEGQLAVDVCQTDDELVVVANMAGTDPADIQLHLHNDLLTIRGERRDPAPAAAEQFFNECYWGKFSRTIVLPVEVKADLVSAQYKNGALVIRLPKASGNNDIPILVVD